MPKNSAEKTALGPRHASWLTIATVLVTVGLFISGLWFVYSPPSFKINGQKLEITKAMTPETRAKGLGGWNELKPNQGMLFIYDSPGIYCFWMKDMKFPIDMIWLNSSKKVIYVEHDVSPKTYPQTFCPDSEAQYVLEVDAGQAHERDIKPGVTAQF